jgi:hypothetical protein
MKTFLRLLIFIAPLFSNAQITTPIIKANFGVDADLRANFFNGALQAGNDDWFNNGTAGSGRFVIDTTGAASIVAGYLADVSPWTLRMASFFRTMSVPQFSIINNRLWLDAVFVRDYHGTDTTTFAAGSNKNGMSPDNWNGVVQNIPDKNDILDMFMHIRRAGPNTTDSLWFFGALSLDNTTGNRYFDFEMYQTDIYYDRVSTQFYGYGPDAGHTSWQFDAAGNVTRPGDIIFTAEYQSSTLTNIEARIWVHNSALSITPANFNWSGQFDGASAGATYGYASILPKTAGAYYTGLGCNNNTWTGPFRVVLQDNSLATNYIKDQFMEFSVNLTKLGLDPVTAFGTDICGTPFNRILVKTRASASFTAELKDFVAPTDLFLAPRVLVAAEVPVFCAPDMSTNIVVTNPSASSVYTWSTPNGSIVGTNVGASITVNAPGTYIVLQQLAAGCNTYATDTFTIVYDSNCVVLQDQLFDFRGNLNGRTANLTWTVSNNSSFLYFDVERSFDGRNFEFVDRVNADPYQPQSASYSAVDDLSELGLRPYIFYRLKLRGVNGSTAYSEVIRLTFGNFARRAMTVLPNPVRNNMQLDITTPYSEPMELHIYDMNGKLVQKMKGNLQAGQNIINVDRFTDNDRGMYLIVVSAGGNVFREKVVLSK